MRNVAAIALLLLLALPSMGCAQDATVAAPPAGAPWSKRIADAFLKRHPGSVTYDSGAPSTKWNYEQGLMLVALNQEYIHSGDKQYFDFVRKNLEQYVDSTGTIRTYKQADYKLDDIGPGRALLAVYKETNENKYKMAADKLMEQLRHQPRTSEGGFWHKKIYPNQMWLDGLFMAEPFYCMRESSSDCYDIANQFILMTKHATDTSTGLMYHGWDESKKERWANPQTGCSPSFWSRSIGWYMMGMMDVLDRYPLDVAQRQEMIAIYQKLSAAVLQYRDEQSGVWYQVIDQGNRTGNYLESSASCMFAYAFAKGARNGYLDKKYLTAAQQSFNGIIKTFVTTGADGMIDLHGTCKSAGLGGTPYRDGSFDYYISETPRTNDMKGIGPFMLAAIELEQKNASSENGK